MICSIVHARVESRNVWGVSRTMHTHTHKKKTQQRNTLNGKGTTRTRTTRETATKTERKEIVSNICFTSYIILIRQFTQSEPRLRKLMRYFLLLLLFRLIEIVLTRAPDIIYSRFLFTASAVACWTNTITTLSLSLYRASTREQARARPTKHYSITGQFSNCSCGILWCDRFFWCDAMRNFQCGKVTDDWNRANSIARLSLKTSVLCVGVCVCARARIDIGQCMSMVDNDTNEKCARGLIWCESIAQWFSLPRRTMSMSITLDRLKKKKLSVAGIGFIG